MTTHGRATLPRQKEDLLPCTLIGYLWRSDCKRQCDLRILSGREWTNTGSSSFLASEFNKHMTSTLNSTATSSVPEEQSLHRQLIQQFYENSIERYGLDSEQTQMFAQHLSAYAAVSK